MTGCPNEPEAMPLDSTYSLRRMFPRPLSAMLMVTLRPRIVHRHCGLACLRRPPEVLFQLICPVLALLFVCLTSLDVR